MKLPPTSSHTRPSRSLGAVGERLRAKGIHPSPQRMVVAEYVLSTDEHPSADEVFARVSQASSAPLLSRATVYNTLNLFVEKGLLCTIQLREGCTVFDPNTVPHHHFIDEGTGVIEDIPWEALEVEGTSKLAATHGLAVESYQVVLRGTKRPAKAPLP